MTIDSGTLIDLATRLTLERGAPDTRDVTVRLKPHEFDRVVWALSLAATFRAVTQIMEEGV